MTAYFNEGYFGVCSRNLDLKEDDTNSFWKVAHRLNLSAHLTQLGRNLAIQGELIGEGIQGNPEGIKGQDLYVFDIWDIDTQSYLPAKERMKIIDSIPGLKSVPILFESVKALSIWNNMDTILAFSDGTSLNASVREGVVFKSIDGNTSFKVLNNQYLLCH